MPNRAPLVAGQFYPADPVALAAAVDAFLDVPAAVATASGAKQTPLLTLLPHAGYLFCGSVIGATLARVRLPERLILLGPNHTGQGAPLAVWPDGVWQTPLGNVPVDTALAAALVDSGAGYSADTQAHAGEHALEVLLPFLQRSVPSTLRITPVCVSCQPDQLEEAALALANAVRACTADPSPDPSDPRTFGTFGTPGTPGTAQSLGQSTGQSIGRSTGRSIGFIVSSDMNHYADLRTTRARDSLALAPFLALDPVTLFNTVSANRISMCGVLPATLGLFACAFLGLTPQTGKAELAAYTTSAAASGDTARVVGYAGAYVA